MGNLFQAFRNFMAGAKQMYGQGFDPRSMCMNMMGTNCSTPQQALQNILNRGLINQEWFNKFSRMI
jgi:hypothetical protein